MRSRPLFPFLGVGVPLIAPLKQKSTLFVVRLLLGLAVLNRDYNRGTIIPIQDC